MAKGYRSLQVWQKAMSLTESIYQITKLLPDSERFGLVTQMQRASISIPCNIAEGHSRSRKDFCRMLQIARGSTVELATQLELCVRLKLLDRESVLPSWNESQSISRMLFRLIRSLKNREDNSTDN